jgi:hypothetical protein
VAKQYKKPDLNAPRFRPKKLNLTNIEFYDRFINENPKYSGVDLDQFKNIIKTFNGMIWNTVINERDGVQLPEQLGYLFIGTCPKKKGENTDYNKSQYYGVKIQNQNWESDQYTAKIFYTNFETKYRFKNHDLWGFKGVRDFTRAVAKTYPKEWKKYVQVDNLLKISRLFRIEKEKHTQKDQTNELLKNYDEFNLD